MILTVEFLNSLDTKIGENLAVYDVAGRKVYFLHHHDTGFRLQQIRSKRRLPVKIRTTDKFVRVNVDGSIEKNNYEGLIVPTE